MYAFHNLALQVEIAKMKHWFKKKRKIKKMFQQITKTLGNGCYFLSKMSAIICDNIFEHFPGHKVKENA